MPEALILAGGKAERLGDAAQGRPKPLVRVGGRAGGAGPGGGGGGGGVAAGLGAGAPGVGPGVPSAAARSPRTRSCGSRRRESRG